MAEAKHPAVESLRTCQRQLDMDGCEVGVSRQALDETLALTDELVAALKGMDAALCDGFDSPAARMSGRRALIAARAAIAQAEGRS